MEDAFYFEDYTTPQLLEILELKMKKQDLAATDAAKATAMQVLDRAKNRKGFGNGGAVDNLLNQAKQRYARRLPATSDQFADTLFEPEDFDPAHDRGNHAATNLVKLFEDVVGHEDIVKKLGEYQRLAQILKNRGMEEKRTGKTTIARKMGQVYYDMGFLSSPEVVECSATDLIGEYVGQTGPKTKKIFEKALGQVLFIDEAYRLSDGKFAHEAIDEIVTLLTLDKFKSKMIVVLAGYEQEINRLLAVNPGLASRFPEEIFFHHLPASNCLEILQRELTKSNVQLLQLDDPSSSGYEAMSELVVSLSKLPTWGNARDMIQLSKILIKTALLKADEAGVASTNPTVLATADALDSMQTMLHEQQKRTLNLPNAHRSPDNLPMQTFSPTPVNVKTQTGTTHQQNRSTPPPAQPETPPDQGRKDLQSIMHTQSASAINGDQVPSTTVQSQPHLPRQRKHRPTPPFNQAQAHSHSPALSFPVVAQKGIGHHQPKSAGPSSPAYVQQGLPQLGSQASALLVVNRDPGVSDAIWNQLQACKREAEERKRKDAEKMEKIKQQIAERAEAEKKQKAAIEALERAAAARNEAERQERQRQLELAYLARKKAEQERQRLAAELRKRRQHEEAEKRKEEAAQQKLQKMGVCVAGFRWIKLPGQGYRCAGGSHFISDQQLQ
ncbi:hypothetical protein C0992_002649 [Termitomyces sp. T32_za158]|nr:hypothetical protein C0992_002649 [Termitomyces sp. T32_za158]